MSKPKAETKDVTSGKATNTYKAPKPDWSHDPDDRFPKCCIPDCKTKAKDLLAVFVPWQTVWVELPYCPEHLEAQMGKPYPEDTEFVIRGI
jgi:hypothetical protein